MENMKGTAVSLLGIDEGTFDVAVIKDAPSHLLGQHKQLAGAYFGSYLCKADDADDGIVVRAFGGAGPGASTQTKKHVTKALAYALCLALYTSFKLQGQDIPSWPDTAVKTHLKTYLPEAFAEALDSHPEAPREIWQEDDVADAAATTSEGNVNREVGDKGRKGRAGSLPKKTIPADLWIKSQNKGNVDEGNVKEPEQGQHGARTPGPLTADKGSKLKSLKSGKKAKYGKAFGVPRTIMSRCPPAGARVSEDVAGGPAASGRRLDDKRESMDVARSHGCRMDVDKDVDMDVRFPTEAAYHAFLAEREGLRQEADARAVERARLRQERHERQKATERARELRQEAESIAVERKHERAARELHERHERENVVQRARELHERHHERRAPGASAIDGWHEWEKVVQRQRELHERRHER